jgi:hypothetical protein
MACLDGSDVPVLYIEARFLKFKYPWRYTSSVHYTSISWCLTSQSRSFLLFDIVIPKLRLV